MRVGAFAEVKKDKSLARRLGRKWWVFLFPLYPAIWIWALTFVLAFFIDQPLQWDQLLSQDSSYVIFRVHPYKAWPARQPAGEFRGVAVTRNLSGIMEAADLWEIWLVPLHLQIAHRHDRQIPAPPSMFLRSALASR
jgi:hypothetical protein